MMKINKLNKKVKKELKGIEKKYAKELVKYLKYNCPEATGKGKKSIKTIRKNGKSYILMNDYLKILNDGAKSHTPPIIPLKNWVQIKLNASENVAYAVQKKIEKEGIEENNWVDKSIIDLRKKLNK